MLEIPPMPPNEAQFATSERHGNREAKKLGISSLLEAIATTGTTSKALSDVRRKQ